MVLDPLVFVLLIAFWVAVAFLLWRLVGIYTPEGGTASHLLNKGSVVLRDWRRLQGDPAHGYLDSFNIFHSHFYEATVEGRPGEPVIVARYFPDAFGRPFRGRLRGKGIRWWGPPALIGFQLVGGRFRLWRLGGGLTDHGRSGNSFADSDR